MKTVTLTTTLTGPFYAFPAAQANFANWSTKRVELTGSAGRFSGSVNTTTDGAIWYVFRGASAPTAWSERIAIADFTIELAIDAIEAVGTGERAITFSVDDGESPAVAVRGAMITIKQSGTVVAVGTTNALGSLAVNLDAGSYTYSISASGFSEIINQAFTVTADATINVDLERIAAPPAGSPSACRVTLRATKNVANEQVRVMITSESTFGHEGQRAFTSKAFDGLTDVNGLLVVDLPWSSTPGVGKYRFKMLDRNTSAVLHDRTCTVPDEPSADYEDLT